MIITRTPFRISFFGGGTDYPKWFQEHGGSVLATTIDKYCYISCRKLPPFFEHKHRIVYSGIENVKNITDIEHPSVREVLKWFDIQIGLEIHHDGDLPARSGLGSSSSFTVGLIHAIMALNERLASKEQLAKDAIYVEQNLIGEAVGSQDQISAAYGGFNKISFHHNGTFEVNPIILPSQRLEEFNNHLMLFFTGFSRTAEEIAKSKIQNIKSKENELLHMRGMVDEGIGILQNVNLPMTYLGQLLDETWKYKRSLSDKVSTAFIDETYEAALDAGACGGKILGAGGGGFILFLVKPENQAAVRARLSKLVHVPFKFENSGSKVVLYHPNGL